MSCADSYLLSLSDGKGREPIILPVMKKDTALYSSKPVFAFGAGHDLSINLIDLKRSESSLLSYAMPSSSPQDPDTLLAGRRDNWDIEELEVF